MLKKVFDMMIAVVLYMLAGIFAILTGALMWHDIYMMTWYNQETWQIVVMVVTWAILGAMIIATKKTADRYHAISMEDDEEEES